MNTNERIIIMSKLQSNRVIANGTDYEVSKQKVQYRVPSVEKYNLGDFIGNNMIVGIIDGKVRLKDITNPLAKSNWVEIHNL